MYEQAEEGIIRENARVAPADPRLARPRKTPSARPCSSSSGGTGGVPRALVELAAAGLSRGPLVDVAGVPFGYDAATGRVFIQETSPMWRPQ